MKTLIFSITYRHRGKSGPNVRANRSAKSAEDARTTGLRKACVTLRVCSRWRAGSRSSRTTRKGPIFPTRGGGEKVTAAAAHKRRTRSRWDPPHGESACSFLAPVSTAGPATSGEGAAADSDPDAEGKHLWRRGHRTSQNFWRKFWHGRVSLSLSRRPPELTSSVSSMTEMRKRATPACHPLPSMVALVRSGRPLASWV